MVEQKIEFRKVREFGENLNDTFLFIRQNLKSLIGPFFAICGIFMLAQAILNGLYQSQNLGAVFGEIFKGRPSARQPFANMFSGLYFLMLLFMLLTFISMQVTLGAYIKFYVEHDGEHPSIEQVWQLFRKYFFKIFFYSIPIGLLIIIGCFFCLVPGVWLWVVWAPFTLVVMVEDQSFSGAFNRCFEIIKENFWISLATYAVSGIIYYFCYGIIGLVVGLIAGVITFLSTDNISTSAAVLTSFLNIFSFTFYIIYFVSLSLHYFNLAERRDGTGILNRINSIGEKDTNFNNIEEQY